MTKLQSAVVTLLLAIGIGSTMAIAFIRDEQIHAEVLQK